MGHDGKHNGAGVLEISKIVVMQDMFPWNKTI